MNFLEEENCGHGSEAKSTVDSAERGTGASGVAVTVTLLGTLVALLTGVDESSLAGVVLGLDKLLLVEVLVEVAGVVELSRRLEVEGTLDVVELGSLDAIRS